ncbi:uncharacterized protein ACA1_152650 [Acanthamoeba castellanii str. Neff]|uniref:Uncharacterized protein n=1 Tax=Acanthamoeba castellanii (strain ATCC 30010 / Neff) TaxID=1257118 RepID=L8HI89_ACACF|nr:uncharacterized protein ACA1_152650 [Acanthamoeba castellanii str. Neff]ELR24086.1 hypothetical protein ACA1_152650 [Acanthamoeba castellanii str. Neff]
MSQDLLRAPEVDVTAQTRPAREEQVTLPTAMVTDAELLKLLKEPTEEELSMPPEEALLKHYVSEDNIHILTWGQNHMHNEVAVHKDEWEDFFQHHNTLCTNKFWTTTQGKQAINWKKLISSMPEAQKLNEAEQRKLQENLRNYTSIMKKFLNINSWPKSATYLKNLYAKSKEPMPITPLYLHNQSISNPILLHVLKHISTKQHKQIQATTFTELLIACQRHVQFLGKARKVATHLTDRDFIHLKNKVATGEWDHHITCDQEQLLLINIEDVIPELQERIQKEKEEKEKAEEKEKRKAKAKGKRKSTNSAEEPFKPAQTHNKTRSDQKHLHKCIEQLQVTCANPKLVDIVLCNISIDASTCHWDQHRLNQMMGYTNPN